MIDMDKNTTEGLLDASEKAAEKIEEGVVTGYKKIETGVVDGYKKIETGVVSGFTKVTDKIVEKIFAKEGETAEEAKKRLIDNQKKVEQQTAERIARSKKY